MGVRLKSAPSVIWAPASEGLPRVVLQVDHADDRWAVRGVQRADGQLVIERRAYDALGVEGWRPASSMSFDNGLWAAILAAVIGSRL